MHRLGFESLTAFRNGGYAVSYAKCPAKVAKPGRSINSSFIPWPKIKRLPLSSGVSCASVPLAIIISSVSLVQTVLDKV